jgi:hypothetical protein
MRRIPHSGYSALAVAFVLSFAIQAKAVAVAIQNRTPTQQAMQADIIVVGKVTAIEKEMSKATQFPGAKDKVDYLVGVVKIGENIQSAKGLTTIRVGWQNVQNPGLIGNPGGPVKGPIRPPIRRAPQATLTEGQEACFFLSKHHDGDFYIMMQWGIPLDRKTADFDKQLDSVKKIVKIIDDPVSGLKTKDAAERQFAACMLLQRYRTYPTNVGTKGQPRQEEIPAEISSLILKTMSEMEWGKFESREGLNIGVQNMFGFLGIQPGQFGFNPPKFTPNQSDFAKLYGEYVIKWIKENSDKYRIQKWAAAK